MATEPKACRSASDAAAEMIVDVQNASPTWQLNSCSIVKLNDGSGWVWSVAYGVYHGNTVAVVRRRSEEGSERIKKVLAALEEAQRVEVDRGN